MKPHPPLTAIRAFEAAARHLSFKKAAEELDLTPAAISQQVKHLERLTGQKLFVRGVRQVTLTPEGSGFFGIVAPAMASLADAYARLVAKSQRPAVTLGIGPILASRWLVPKLGDLWGKFPSVDLRVHHSRLPIWQQINHCDLAIAWGKGDWQGLESRLLMRIRVTPVAAPSMMGRMNGSIMTDHVIHQPLLHHQDDTGWRQWLKSAGIASPANLPGPVFEDANVLLQATLSGRGISLGILEFIDDELSSGKLIRPFELAVTPEDAYYVVWQKRKTMSLVASQVRDWLHSDQRDFDRNADPDAGIKSG